MTRVERTHRPPSARRARNASILTCLALSVEAQPTAKPTSQPPETPEERQWKARIALEMQRVGQIGKECADEAERLEAARQKAIDNARLPEAEEVGKLLKAKMQCVEAATEELEKLRAALTVGYARGQAIVRSFQEDYEQGLLRLHGGLQHFTGRLGAADLTYDTFAPKMVALRRDLEAFRNQYSRLVAEGAHRRLASLLFQACESLIASADAWRREVEAERKAATAGAEGDAAASMSARFDRDAAQGERMGNWGTAQDLVKQAGALIPTGRAQR